jgi:hypothetical protein
MRKISEIAREIEQKWTNVWFGARPYLSAMRCLFTIEDSVGADDAKTVIIYFLSNATTWRGEDARRIKSELKQIAGIK